MSIKYKIYQDRDLLVDILDNNITLKDLEKLFLEVSKKNKYKKVLSNIENAEMNFSIDELYKFIKFMMSPNPDSEFRWAIMTKSPIQTAVSYLIKEDIYFKKFVGVFSTLEGCITFLNVSFKVEEFNDDDYHQISIKKNSP
jgi:hypothetical protein